MAQEIEYRLDLTIRDEALLAEIAELTFGAELAGTLLALGFAMKFVARGNWLDEPYRFREVAQAAAAFLEAIRPEGDPSPPASMSQGERQFRQHIGEFAATSIAMAIRQKLGTDEKHIPENIARAIRQNLGERALNRLPAQILPPGSLTGEIKRPGRD